MLIWIYAISWLPFVSLGISSLFRLQWNVLYQVKMHKTTFFFFFLFLGFTFRGMKLWLVWIKSLKVRRCIVSQWSGRRPELLKWRKMQMSNGWTERPFFIICTLLLTRDVCQSVGLHAECLGWQVHSPLQIFRTIFIWLQFTLFSFHRTTKSLSVSGRVCFTFCVKYL